MRREQPSLADLASSLSRLGVERLYLSQDTYDKVTAKHSPSLPQPATTKEQSFIRSLRKPSEKVLAEKRAKLLSLEEPLRSCMECGLCESRTNLVYGVGNPDADLMFIGEGPGRDEDLQGEPFVGRGGKLLTDMITKGMRIRREDVYIANIVKCRPPENRNPEPEEMAACMPNLLQQVEIIAPKVIVTLGAVPARAFLKEKLGITRLRGSWRWHQGIPVMPTLHPAYLLRNPPAKKDCWEDLKQVIAFMNGEFELNPPVGDEE